MPDPAPEPRAERALDTVNVFLADVRDGVGPYLAIYLVASHGWAPGRVGIAMAASGLASVVVQAPAGALVDAARRGHRWLVAAPALAVGAACVLMALLPTFGVVLAAQAMIGMAAAVVGPAVAALTLGIVGYERLDRRVGRNEAFNHGGNVLAAVAAGLLGHFIAREWIFYLVGAFALASAVAVLAIPARAIDARRASGHEGDIDDEGPPTGRSGLRALLSDSRLAWFAAALVLFHIANAAMLPLVGQYLTVGRDTGASLFMSACIIVAQVVMIPVAVAAGRLADTRGRRALLLVAFGVLPLRGLLYTVSAAPAFLISVQILDGIAGGLLGVVVLLVVADLTRGTGRFNVTQGVLATATGLGATLSNAGAGYVVEALGYPGTFAVLAALAGVAFAVLFLRVPETRGVDPDDVTSSPHFALP